MSIRTLTAVLGISMLSLAGMQARAQASQSQSSASQTTSGNTLSENEAIASQLDHPVKISSAALDAMVLTKVAPVYPQEAKDQALEGSVVLWAVIDEEGKIKSLDVISGPEMFRLSALKAVNQWTYTPYMQDGKAVKMAAPIAINFSLKN